MNASDPGELTGVKFATELPDLSRPNGLSWNVDGLRVAKSALRCRPTISVLKLLMASLKASLHLEASSSVSKPTFKPSFPKRWLLGPCTVK